MASILQPFGNLLTPGDYQVPLGQLTIDWSNPLSNGLLGCWVPGAMGINDVTGQTPTVLAGTGNAFAETAFGDTAPEGPGELGRMQIAMPTSYRTGTWTIWWRGYFKTFTNNAQFWGFGLLTDTFPIISADTDGSGAAWRSNDNTGVSQNGGGSHAGLNDVVVTVVNSGAQTMYREASQTNQFSPAEFPISYNTYQYINIGGYFIGPNTNAITTIFGVWGRAISADEVTSLYLNPYQFLIPAEYELPMLSPPAVPPSMVFSQQIITIPLLMTVPISVTLHNP